MVFVVGGEQNKDKQLNEGGGVMRDLIYLSKKEGDNYYTKFIIK